MARREKPSVEQQSRRGDGARRGDQAVHINGFAQDRMQPFHTDTRSTQRLASTSRQQFDDLNDAGPNNFSRGQDTQAPLYHLRYHDEMTQDGHYDVDPMLENVDPSPAIGHANNSLESQQRSDTAAEHAANREGSCRVSWCEHPGKRYGLCWAHGGVKKCCERNCPKIARDTSEFCSIHEREVSHSTI